MGTLIRLTRDLVAILLGIGFMIQGGAFLWESWPQARYPEAAIGIGVIAVGAYLVSLSLLRLRRQSVKPPAPTQDGTPEPN